MARGESAFAAASATIHQLPTQNLGKVCNICGGRVGARVTQPDDPWGGFLAGGITERPQPREWIVDDMIPRKVVTLLAGSPKSAKSYLLMQLLTSAALGAHWIGRPTHQVKGIGLFLEDDATELQERQFRICSRYGIKPFMLGENLELNPREWMQTKLICFERGSDDPHWTPFGDTFWSVVKGNGYQLIVLDTATKALGWPAKWGGDRASNVVTLITRQIAKFNAALIITDHTNKADPAGFSGPNTWWGSVRAAMNLRLPIDQFTNERRRDKRVLTDLGGNYGSFEPIRLKWLDNLIVVDDEPELTRSQPDYAIGKILAAPNARWLVMAYCADLPDGITMTLARSGKCWYRHCDSTEAEDLLGRLARAKVHGNVKRLDDTA